MWVCMPQITSFSTLCAREVLEEIGAVEGAHFLLHHHFFALQRSDAGVKGSVRLGLVPDVNDKLPFGAEFLEELLAVRRRSLRTIERNGTARKVELLDVDHDESRDLFARGRGLGLGKRRHGARHEREERNELERSAEPRCARGDAGLQDRCAYR